MTGRKGLTEKQVEFLRGFGEKKEVEGKEGKKEVVEVVVPEVKDWPTAKVMERWMRRVAFRRVFLALARAMQWEVRMHAMGRAVVDGRKLSALKGGGTKAEVKELTETMKVAAVLARSGRGRAKKKGEEEEELTFEEQVELLKHPSVSSEEAVAFFKGRLEGKWAWGEAGEGKGE
jgi:hypothetical protein